MIDLETCAQQFAIQLKNGGTNMESLGSAAIQLRAAFILSGLDFPTFAITFGAAAKTAATELKFATDNIPPIALDFDDGGLPKGIGYGFDNPFRLEIPVSYAKRHRLYITDIPSTITTIPPGVPTKYKSLFCAELDIVRIEDALNIEP